MSGRDFTFFGDRRSFAIEARFIADPDEQAAATDESWSFGEFRIYVRDRCLTRHTAPGGIRDEIRWYLAPLLGWLSQVWLPLFHEQRFPFTVGSHEHTIVRFEQGERLLFDDSSAEASARRADMQAWRKRHAMWSAAGGGVLPNIWLRRQSDLCEISYDPGVTIGAPSAFQFQFSRGAALVDIEDVAGALLDFLKWGTAIGSAEGQGIQLPEKSLVAVEEAKRWIIGDHLADVLIKAQVSAPRLAHGVLYPLSPEVAMFGTLTPKLSNEDAFILLNALRMAQSPESERPNLSSLIVEMAPATRETSWEQGYDLALQTIDALGFDEEQKNPIDIEHLLLELGVRIEALRITDLSLRGVAIAGEGFHPTIIVNESAKWNKSGPGRRFTLAHEFGHILVDRGRARRVTHSSTPWAPETLERRANAFAAMFLMPYRAVDTALAEIGQVTDERQLRRVATRLDCGKTAVLEHLMNIDRLDPDVYFRVKSETAAV